MTEHADRLVILREFGLSEYGARAYLAVLAAGEADAREVSRAAKVPLVKVYQVLATLQRKGLVEFVLGKTKRYRAVAFDVFLENLKREHERAAEAVSARRTELEGIFSSASSPPPTDRGRVQLVNGRAAVLALETRLLERASSRVLIVCTPGRLRRMRKTTADLDGLAARGVDLEFLVMSTPTWEKDSAGLRQYGEVRARSYPTDGRGETVAFLVLDRTSILIVDGIPDDGDLRRGDDVAMHVTHPGMVSALGDALDALWNAATAGRRARR